MKVKLELKRMTKKNMADVIALTGVVAILCVVAFPIPNDIPVGEMAYQKLCLGRMAFVFVICCLFSFYLNRKTCLSFSSIVTWALIVLGGIEAIWGLRQIYGLAVSNHSLYALTGSFYNPGPYSGYLAMIFPLCLHEWLNLKERPEPAWIEWGKYCMALGVMLLILCVLPAGMSRSAWISAAVSGAWVYGMHVSWGSKLKEIRKKYKRKVVLACIAGGIMFIVISYSLFQLKAASANGRLFMWKISALAIAESPVIGHGTGNFVSAYGRAQENYFANGEYSETEELVAGSPEYAFNEYLQVAIEYGIPFLFVVLLIIAFCFWKGSREGRIGLCGSIIAVLVFAFSSYPMQISGFAVTFYFLLAACVIGRSKIMLLLFISMIALLGVYYWKYNQYDACKNWYRSKMLYNIGAYQSAKEEYGKLYSELKNRGAFLFEYGYCLHKLKQYDSSTIVLEEAMKHSCDPMILNIIGKNYQAVGKYEKAEESLIRSTHWLPGRIYPYYLLTKLYAEPEYRKPEKLKRMVEVVLTKEPKVQSTAVKEMRVEVKKLLKQIN
ncbi:O-antigen ligase family protein [Bacteroides sp. A1-P5]|uniref:O-antigen ligase family protein n=1 Tax=Bacteroides vicugnae TaxID=3037989 RepID=A0ABU5HJJ3_9BACE|nr:MULTISPECIES: O-antigen ligase family protein [unclassified Bacteroides]MDY7251908.1 O-antigen ligase family protein [Bacteroides sp. A1-P5]MDY7256363.1 O-antigen ligase family protein [Bacteroides sp. A2-P53]